MSFAVNNLDSVKEIAVQMIPTSCELLLAQARAGLDIAQQLVIHKQTINAVVVTFGFAIGLALGVLLPCLIFWMKFSRCLKWQWQLDHGLLPHDSSAARMVNWRNTVMETCREWSRKADAWAKKWGWNWSDVWQMFNRRK